MNNTIHTWSLPLRELHSSSNKLLGAMHLQQNLPTSLREYLQNIFLQFQRQRETSVDLALQDFRTNIQQLPSKKSLNYLTEKWQLNDPKELESRVDTLAKSFFSSCYSSVKESTSGLDGVLLIHYQWKTSTQDFVVKWTDASEVASGEIIRLLSQELKAPQALLIDHEKDTVSQELSFNIANNFKKIRSLFSRKDREPSTSSMMISELVPSKNLGDFVCNNEWRDLNAFQKELVFRSFGECFLIDLLLGNTDRLFNVAYPHPRDPVNTPTTFDNYHQMNLGNLMLYPREEELSVYAIDNKPYERNLLNREDYEQYNNFVTNTLKSENWAHTMADAIISSLNEASNSDYFEEIDNLDEKKQKLANFAVFLNDLNLDQTKEILMQSLVATRERITTNSDLLQNALNGIQEQYPGSEDICTAVATRLTFFNT